MQPHKSTVPPAKPLKTRKKRTGPMTQEKLGSELRIGEYVQRPDGTFMNISDIENKYFYLIVWTFTGDKLKIGTDEVVVVQIYKE